MSTLPPIYTETDISPAFDMILVDGGTFLMGGDDPEAYDDEKPVHEVHLSDFYLARYPVTQALWQAVMGKNPSYFKGENRPVEQVSWDDAQAFIKNLNQLTQKSYRLPSEAEWEYAARGGRSNEGYLYAGSDKLKEVAWYSENSGLETQPVGLKLPNELGLYDMSGNVREWCEDGWHNNYNEAPQDGSAWISGASGANRVLRGGSWSYDARLCRVSIRRDNTPGNRFNILGFRLALPPGSVSERRKAGISGG